MTSWHDSQRGYFAGALLDAMRQDKRIWLVTADLGYGMLDKIRDAFPHRFVNVGAAEQAMLGVGVGLALEGKKPFVYTITSFYLRAAETISLYLDHEQIPVRLIGGGRNADYKHDGYSHDASRAQEFLEMLDIDCLYPENKTEIPLLVKRLVKEDRPAFLSLRR